MTCPTCKLDKELIRVIGGVFVPTRECVECREEKRKQRTQRKERDQ